MENERGNKILHPDFEILKYNGASLGEGKMGKGLELGGNGEYAWFGDQRNSCLGNLTRCSHGVTNSFFIYPSPHTNSHHYYLSSAASSFFSNATHVIIFNYYNVQISRLTFIIVQFSVV